MRINRRFRPLLIAAFVACVAGSVGACSSDSGDSDVKGAGKMPAMAELNGYWFNRGKVDLTTRVIQFEEKDSRGLKELAGKSGVYHILQYEAGQPPKHVQSGTYELIDGHWKTNVMPTPTWERTPRVWSSAHGARPLAAA